MIDLTQNSRQLRYIKKYGDKRVIVVKHGHISIRPYKLGDNPNFEKYLSVWRKNIFKLELIGAYYVPHLQELRVPRGLNVSFIKYSFPKYDVVVDNDHIKYDKVDIELKVPPKSDIQLIAISHMLSAPPYQDNAKYTQQLITMDTGEGKSFSAIAAIAFLKAKAIIVAPTVKIAEQWIDYYKKYTNIKNDQLLLVSGGKIAKEVYRGEHTNKVAFVFINKTLQEFIKNHTDSQVETMFENTGAMIKIIDEVHRNMVNNTAIDCLSNFRMNYYLTATDNRADRFEDRVFQRVFKNMPKSSGLKQIEESHINVLIHKYYYKPSPEYLRKMYTVRNGLNSNLFEMGLIEEGWSKLRPELYKLLKWCEKKNDGNHKILILTSTIAGIEKIKNYIEEIMPDKKVRTYHSAMPKKAFYELNEGDIIIVTDKAFGYGADLPGARFMINIVTYSNKIGAKQFKGRLRKIPGYEVYYFELVNYGYIKTINQFDNRKEHLKSNAKDSIIIETN